MSDQYIAKYCAPTLAGIKTGSLFTAAYTDREMLARELRELNGVLTRHGLRAIPLRYSKRRALIYLYRPAALSQDLCMPEAASILREKGYGGTDPGLCLRRLIRQFRETDEFPHEIGLFLSYPPEDVRGFMENPHRGYKCVGFWKVYGDRERAERTFTRYRRCTEAFCRATATGKRLDNLIVGTKQPAVGHTNNI